MTRGVLVVAAAGFLVPVAGATASANSDPVANAPGAVFSMTNDTAAEGGNKITAFGRSADGTLDRKESIATGGDGTGTPEDSANGLILANVNGRSSPTNLSASPKFLMAANGGSNSISVFRN